MKSVLRMLALYMYLNGTGNWDGGTTWPTWIVITEKSTPLSDHSVMG